MSGCLSRITKYLPSFSLPSLPVPQFLKNGAAKITALFISFPPAQAKKQKNLGWVHYQNGEFEKAWTCFNDAIGENPTQYSALAMRAKTEFHQNNFAGARDDATMLINYIERSQDTSRSDAQTVLGDIHLSENKFYNALQYYIGALRNRPNNVVAAEGKILALYNLKRYDEALATAQKLPALCKNNRTDCRWEKDKALDTAYFYSGLIQMNRGNFPEAKNWFEQGNLDAKGIQRNHAYVNGILKPTERPVVNAPSSILQGRILADIALAQSTPPISEIDQKDKDLQEVYWMSLGQQALREKDYGAAVAHFSKVIQSDPDNLYALSGRAKAYQKTTQKSEALADARQVIEKYQIVNEGYFDEHAAARAIDVAAHYLAGPKQHTAKQIAIDLRAGKYREVPIDKKTRDKWLSFIPQEPS